MAPIRIEGPGRRRKRVLLVIVLAVLVLLVSGFIYGYYVQHGMKPVAAREIGSPSATHRLLIATQGSRFKDRLVSDLIARIQRPDAYVKVIDVDALARENDRDWQSVVIVHSWEFGQPPAAASDFVARASDSRRILDVTTSGSGREKLPGVDVISSASVVDDVPDIVHELGGKIDGLFASP